MNYLFHGVPRTAQYWNNIFWWGLYLCYMNLNKNLNNLNNLMIRTAR